MACFTAFSHCAFPPYGVSQYFLIFFFFLFAFLHFLSFVCGLLVQFPSRVPLLSHRSFFPPDTLLVEFLPLSVFFCPYFANPSYRFSDRLFGSASLNFYPSLRSPVTVTLRPLVLRSPWMGNRTRERKKTYMPRSRSLLHATPRPSHPSPAAPLLISLPPIPNLTLSVPL